MRDAILMLTNRLPWPVDDGWKRRTFHVVHALAGHGRVTLQTFHEGAPRDVAALVDAVPGRLEVVTVRPPAGARLLAAPLGVVSGTPFLTWRVRSRRFTESVRRLHRERQFRVAVAGLTHLYRHLRVLPDTCLRVIDTHNIDSVVMARYAANPDRNAAWRWFARRTARQLRRQELRDFAHADSVWVCSEAEAAWAEKHVPEAHAVVIPNGVDTRAFRADSWQPPVPDRILFFGRMDYHPNADGAAWFAESMFPAIRAARPEAELILAGPGDPPELRALRDKPGIHCLGPVPDVRPIIASAGVVVVPLRSGGGTRLKILESLAMGRPVVTTTVGMEGLALRPDRDLLTVDTAEAMTEAVLRVLSDPSLGERLGASGRETVGAYDWASIEASIVARLEEATGRRARDPGAGPDPTR